ncbi:unnamed protein product [Didymodactylos carnosus]|uniref:Ig-like domain-containing protein n=1 Tax=Didymodactylos carnosus TaxID=1234261 RepID=A0A814WV16_9BILA|nr:unnamed protein product [Didymodactylos carnosus]CAF1206750.1 unnamed protein product [Didymodactylos carnosus]CAF3826742.1 unnamed protein product [Didymodactylos carnosus]CAF3970988.1 unnamed protein product [Didymodactylos carnosus]
MHWGIDNNDESIVCPPIESHQNAIVKWSKNGKPLSIRNTSKLLFNHSIEYDEKYYLLTIKRMKKQDAGTYVCEMSDNKSSIHHLVLYQSKPSVTENHYNRGDNIELQCYSTTSRDIKWYKDGVLIAKDKNREKYTYGAGTILLNNIDKKDNGIYSCQYLGKIHNTERLIVDDALLTYKNIGDDFGIECELEHDITAKSGNVIWMKDGKLLPTSYKQTKYIYHQQILVVKNISPKDAGLYACKHLKKVHPVEKLIVEKNKS